MRCSLIDNMLDNAQLKVVSVYTLGMCMTQNCVTKTIVQLMLIEQLSRSSSI